MTFGELVEKARIAFPRCEIMEDSGGQLIILTHKYSNPYAIPGSFHTQLLNKRPDEHQSSIGQVAQQFLSTINQSDGGDDETNQT